jgi:hypothetical protein
LHVVTGIGYMNAGETLPRRPVEASHMGIVVGPGGVSELHVQPNPTAVHAVPSAGVHAGDHPSGAPH